MERQFGLDFIRVTEFAALAAARTMGKGDEELSDRVSTDTIRAELNKLPIRGRVVIGEGDDASKSRLFVGEEVGDWEKIRNAWEVDIAVDPLENNKAVAFGGSSAAVVLAVSERGGILNAPDVYMDKIIVGPTAVGKVDINATPTANVQAIAKAFGRDPDDILIAILDRERNQPLINEVKTAGARIQLIRDGDLTLGIAAAIRGTGMHAVMGIGGAPEGVLAAAALRCLGGEIQAKFMALNPEHEKRLRQWGITDLTRVYKTKDLVSGEQIVFAATAVTRGDLLKGVRFFSGGARTESLFMGYQNRKIRFIDTVHVFEPDVMPVLVR